MCHCFLQKDIIDTPPNPSQPITASRLTPIPKPYERRWEAPASWPTEQAASSNNLGVISPPALQSGGAIRSISGVGSTSRSRFAPDRPSDFSHSTPTPDEFYLQHDSIDTDKTPSTESETHLVPAGRQEQRLLQSFSQSGGSATSGVVVPAATTATAASAVALAAEQAAPQHHRISILPAPGTGPVWRPPPVPAPTMPARQPYLAAEASDVALPEDLSPEAAPVVQNQLNTTIQTSQEQEHATPSSPLASFPIEEFAGTTHVKSGPSSPTSGNLASRGAGAFTLNSNAKPFTVAAAAPAAAPAASPVQKSPRRRGQGSANASAVADASVASEAGVAHEGGWSVVSPAVQQEVVVSGGQPSPSNAEVQSHP